MKSDYSSFNYSSLPYRVAFAKGLAHTVLPQELDHFGVSKILVITSEGAWTRHQEIRHCLDSTAKVIYTNVKEHVPQAVVTEATALALGSRCDLVLSLGGGSVIGIAKAISLNTNLPIIAVPTTYSGSEVTPIVGITTNGVKTTVTDSRILPKSVIYDPDLTKSLRKELTLTSSFNAIAHAVGSLHSHRRNPLTSAIAVQAITRILKGLHSLTESQASGTNFRDELLVGSFMAGVCLAHTGASIHHGLCHLLGGSFDLAHSDTHAVILPYSLELMLARSEEPGFETSIRQAFGDDPVQCLREIARTYGFTTTLKDLGLNELALADALSRIEKMKIDQAETLKQSDLQNIVDRAWTGK